MKTLEDSFMERVKKGGKCWEWQGCVHQSGYGDFRYYDRRERAHRMSWELFYGEKPKKLILHSCDNRKCVKPVHLFEGTHLDNSKDCTQKNRHANQLKKYCPQGHKYTELNTYIHKNRSRRCKKCHSLYYQLIKNVKIWSQ